MKTHLSGGNERAGQVGAILLETALSMGLLLLLLLGAIEVARMGDLKQRSQMAASYAARSVVATGGSPDPGLGANLETTYFRGSESVAWSLEGSGSQTVVTVQATGGVIPSSLESFRRVFDPDADGHFVVSETVELP